MTKKGEVKLGLFESAMNSAFRDPKAVEEDMKFRQMLADARANKQTMFDMLLSTSLQWMTEDLQRNISAEQIARRNAEMSRQMQRNTSVGQTQVSDAERRAADMQRRASQWNQASQGSTQSGMEW